MLGHSEQFQHLHDTLTEAGAVITIQETISDTDESITHDLYDAVVLDCITDEVGATALLKRLQARNETKQLPVFAIVPADTGGSAERVLEHGAADFITALDTDETARRKIANLLGETNENVPSSHVIDITPHAVPTGTQGSKVFFVEDDMLLHNLLDTKFSSSGFSCKFSTDGRDVVSHVTEYQPDVIILDIMLPGVDGLDVLAELKENPTTKEIPTIIFTNRDEKSDRERADSLGADAFFIKAMTDLSDLAAEVQRLTK